MVNKLILIGHVGRDSEIKPGKNYCTFSLATNHSFKDKSGEWQDRTTWHNVQQYGDKSYRKGELLFIEARQENRQYQDNGVTKYFSVAVALSVRRLSKREDSRPWDDVPYSKGEPLVSDAQVEDDTTPF